MSILEESLAGGDHDVSCATVASEHSGALVPPMMDAAHLRAQRQAMAEAVQFCVAALDGLLAQTQGPDGDESSEQGGRQRRAAEHSLTAVLWAVLFTYTQPAVVFHVQRALTLLAVPARARSRQALLLAFSSFPPRCSSPMLLLGAGGLHLRNESWALETAQAHTAAPASGAWYFEICVLSAGAVQLGWTSQHHQATSGLALGDDEGESLGYDGLRAVSCGPERRSLGARWQVGDVIGCGLDMNRGSMLLSINGTVLGCLHSGRFDTGSRRWSPTITLGPGQQVLANFGRFGFWKPVPNGYGSLDPLWYETGRSGGGG